VTYTHKIHYTRDIPLRCSILPTKNLLVEKSNAFDSADTIKKMAQLIKAKILLTEKKSNISELS